MKIGYFIHDIENICLGRREGSQKPPLYTPCHSVDFVDQCLGSATCNYTFIAPPKLYRNSRVFAKLEHACIRQIGILMYSPNWTSMSRNANPNTLLFCRLDSDP